MPITLGILAQARQAPVAAGSYDLLETVTVGSGGAASVSFTSLNATYGATYKHLQFRMMVRTDRALNRDQLGITLNADGGSNYANHYLAGNGSVVRSAAAASQVRFNPGNGVYGNTAPANTFSAVVFDLLDAFSTTKNKTARMLSSGIDDSNTLDAITLGSGLWMNTAAVTTVTFDPVNSNLLENCRFSLYGIKG
jgi:hypothetical protein